MVSVVYEKADDFVECLRNVNCVIASFTTCHARLRLYHHMEFLQERVLYSDTDSLIYFSRQGQPKITTGDCLGDMTNEMKPNEKIVEFVSGGTKQYGYRYLISDGVERHVAKLRGFSLRSALGAEKLNFAILKHQVLQMFEEDAAPTPVMLCFTQICRLPGPKIVTKVVEKVYSPVYRKRHMLKDYSTLPFGYCE